MTLALFLAIGFVQKTHAMDKGEEIASRAESYRGSDMWARYAEKYQDGKSEADRDPKGNPYIFRKNGWKCNLFVHDMLYRSGINPPLSPDGWPIRVAMRKRGSLDDKYKFEIVSRQQRGDIVSNGEHCGIAIDNGSGVMAAGRLSVDINPDIYKKYGPPTIRRYTGL